MRHGAAMDESSLDRVALLTDKQRDCLRLVWRHQESKEIARTLGISPHSVDGRIKTAMRTLDADDRYEAARLLALAEGAETDQPPVYGSSDIPVGHFYPSFPPSLNAGERPAGPLVLEEAQAAYHLSPTPGSWFAPPLPTTGRPRNELSASTRLFWVVIVAILTAIAFGALAAGLEALSRLA